MTSAPVVAATVMAAVPLAAVLYVRRFGPPAPRSLGRHALLYAGFYAAALLGFDRAGAVVTLLAYCAAIGFLSSPRGMALAARAVAGRAWLAAHPDAPRADARRVFIPLFSIAVVAFAAAMFARVLEIARLTAPGAPGP